MPIEWSDDMSVADPHIDQDHKMLIQMINRYETAVHSGCCLELKSSLNRLADFAISHFEREEQVMRIICFPHHAEHTTQHNKLLFELNAFLSNLCPHIIADCPVDCENKTKKLPNKCTDFYHWLLHHVVEEDSLMKSFIQMAYFNRKST
jgi:hemerythrin